MVSDCQPAPLLRGTAVVGEARRFRVVLRNRNLCANVGVRISVHDAPFVHATFAEGPLAPGIPRVIEITAVRRCKLTPALTAKHQPVFIKVLIAKRT